MLILVATLKYRSVENRSGGASLYVTLRFHKQPSIQSFPCQAREEVPYFLVLSGFLPRKCVT